MIAVVILVVALLAVGVAALARLDLLHVPSRGTARTPLTRTRRILFPFVGEALSPRALDAALRLASAEDATLVPVFLARVSLDLPLETPLPRQSGVALPLQEAIEQRAMAFGVPVDSRIERGRTYRHALRQTIAHEHFDRIVVAAAANGEGFDADDVAWLLDNAPGEIVVLRPNKNELIGPRVRRRRRRRRLLSRAGGTAASRSPHPSVP